MTNENEIEVAENNVFLNEKDVRKKSNPFDVFWMQVGLSMVLVICILVINIVNNDYAAVFYNKFTFEVNREFNLFTVAYNYAHSLFA
jgi:hypothetical protein